MTLFKSFSFKEISQLRGESFGFPRSVEELPSGGRLDILLAPGGSLDLAHGLAKAFRNDEPEELGAKRHGHGRSKAEEVHINYDYDVT